MSYIVIVPQKGQPSKHSDTVRDFWERQNALLRGAPTDNRVKIIDCDTEEDADSVLEELTKKRTTTHKAVPKPTAKKGKK